MQGLARSGQLGGCLPPADPDLPLLLRASSPSLCPPSASSYQHFSVFSLRINLLFSLSKQLNDITENLEIRETKTNPRVAPAPSPSPPFGCGSLQLAFSDAGFYFCLLVIIVSGQFWVPLSLICFVGSSFLGGHGVWADLRV